MGPKRRNEDGPESLAAATAAGSHPLPSHVPECFWSTRILDDGTPRVHYVSQGWKLIWGYEPEELLRDPHLWLKAVWPEDRVIAEETFQETISRKETRVARYRILSKQGMTRWIEDTMSPLLDESGEVVGVEGVARKISERELIQRALEEREARLNLVLEASCDGMWTLDLSANRVTLSSQWCQALGYGTKEMARPLSFWAEVVHPEDKDRRNRALEAHVQGLTDSFESEHRLCTSSGSYRWYLDRGRIVDRDERERARRVVGVSIDITQRVEAEAALRASEERYRALYEDNPSMFFTLAPDGILLSANRFGAEQLGYTASDIVGKPVDDLYIESEKQANRAQLETCLADPRKIHSWKTCKQRKDGTRLWVWETARVVTGPDGGQVVLVVCEDITEAHEASEKLSYQAVHDALTGVFNRYEFERRLKRALDSAKSEGVEHALCYLDLDRFKVINDTCGHAAGDELLGQLADLIQKSVRKRDVLARLGGDEFGVLLEFCSLAEARSVVASIQKAIAAFRFDWEDSSFSIGVSVGLVSITDTTDSIDDVLRAADTACYAAKDGERPLPSPSRYSRGP
ncbi:MAG: PAS domain S-box protein [bacterium]|nr:PAS domain S-box protein [bacterium]